MKFNSVTRFASGALVLLGCSGGGETVDAVACAQSPFRHSPPLVIAHAGGEGLGPANSILAMQRSMSVGADLLDADLWMTADGVVVAHHDRGVASVAISGNIDELTWAELQLVDLRSEWTGEAIDQPVRVASLEQILKEFPDVMISLEIKQSAPSIATALCDVLRAQGASDRVYLSANDDDDVYAAQERCPESVVITTTYGSIHLPFTPTSTTGSIPRTRPAISMNSSRLR